MAATEPVLHPALWVAALMGQTEAARQLLSVGANTEEQGGTAPFQSTPLQVASRRGHVELVELLLENGADVTVNVGGGRTILHEAARRGLGAISQLLLQHGADVSARDNRGFTPLDAVAMEGREEVAVVLFQHGADVSGQDILAMTALSWAAHQGHVALVRVLIAHRANVSAKDNMGLTAEDYATSQSHPHVVALLQAPGPSAWRLPWDITSGWVRGRGCDCLIRRWCGWCWSKCEDCGAQPSLFTATRTQWGASLHG